MKLTTLLGAASVAALAAALPAAAQDAELTVLDYPGFENADFHATYIEAHGDSPTFSFFGDEEEAFQKVRAGFAADVTHICAGSVTKWVESGILEPWDISRVPEYANIDRNLTGTEVGGDDEVYWIPVDFGSTAIAYNPEHVSLDQLDSLQVFQNPEFAGRMTIPDNVDDAYALAYLATGVTDWSDVSDEEFEAASAWLREVHPNLRTYWVDPAELSQLLASGEIIVSWAWNETFPTMVDEGRPVGYQRETTEGSSVWLCGYVNMADGEGSEDKAYDFINAMLDPSSTMALVADGYGHANVAALTDQVTEEDLTASGIGTIDVPVLAQLPISNEQRERQAETFEMIKAGF